MKIDYKSRLVAHRGDHERAPENSLQSLQNAISAGAEFFEFDVQLSKDKAPYMVHDANLQRVSGVNASIFDFSSFKLEQIKLTNNEILPRLSQAIAVLNCISSATVFVEVKTDSIQQFGAKVVLDKVLMDLSAAKFNFVVISYHEDFIDLARQQGLTCGWVHDVYEKNTIKTAELLGVDYLFTAAKSYLQNADLNCKCKLALYTVNNATQIRELLNLEAGLIETDYFSKIYKELSA